MRNCLLSKYSCSVSLLALTVATVGQAAPVLRTQVNQRGDFVMFGNTLGWDCAANSNPISRHRERRCGTSTAARFGPATCSSTR